MAKVTSPVQKSKPVFDPNVSYRWEENDIFEFTGLQLAALYHCLAREVNDPQGASIAFKMEAYNAVMDVFRNGIFQGVIKESSDQTEAQDSTAKLFQINDNGKEETS